MVLPRFVPSLARTPLEPFFLPPFPPPPPPPPADTLVGADLVVMEEGHELLQRLAAALEGRPGPGPLPMFTSCCPGWIAFVESCAPDLIPYVSSVKSPHMVVRCSFVQAAVCMASGCARAPGCAHAVACQQQAKFEVRENGCMERAPELP